jgi:hypothetical protein
MQVTALVFMLTSVAAAFGALRFAARLLVTRRGPIFRLIVAASGLGYGLDASLRGTTLGVCLVLAGGGAAMSLANAARHRLRALTRDHGPTDELPGTVQDDVTAPSQSHGRDCRRKVRRVGDRPSWRFT